MIWHVNIVFTSCDELASIALSLSPTQPLLVWQLNHFGGPGRDVNAYLLQRGLAKLKVPGVKTYLKTVVFEKL